MKTAYFSKVTQYTSWTKLMTNINNQKKNKITPLPYSIIVEIPITIPQFNYLSQDLLIANECYLPYVSLSKADSCGIWNCILIRSIPDMRNVLLYTSGNIYPLYASIIDM